MGIRNTGKGISVLERYQVTGIFYDKEYKKYRTTSHSAVIAQIRSVT